MGVSSLDYTTASSSRCFSPLSPLLIDSFLSLIPRAQVLLDMTRRTKHASTVQLVQILKSQLATEFTRCWIYLLLNLLAIQSSQLLQCTRTAGLTFEKFQQAESLSKLMVRGGKTVGMGWEDVEREEGKGKGRLVRVSKCIHLRTHAHVCVCVCVYVFVCACTHTHLYRERERERERDNIYEDFLEGFWPIYVLYIHLYIYRCVYRYVSIRVCSIDQFNMES